MIYKPKNFFMRKFKFTTLLLALFLGFTTQAQFLQLSVVSQTNLQIMNMSDYDANSALQAITMQTFKAYNPGPMGVQNECTAVPIISTASNITYTTANLNWLAPEGGSGNYKVQWSDSDGFTSVIGEESVSAEQYSISGLTNKTTYYYRVQSVCDNSELSEWSAVESFQTGGYTPIEVTGFNEDVIANGT